MTTAATSEPPSRPDATFKGIGWMLLTGALFVAFTGIVRYLGTDMNPMQAAFIRYAIGTVLIVPVFLRLGSVRRPVRVLRLYALRGVIHGLGVVLWFFAIAHIPIAEVTALGFTAPIFTTIGAALFLGETLHFRRIAAVLIGFGGALIILQPGFQTIELGAIAQLVAAPLFAASFIVTKRLTETESSASIVAFLSVSVTLVLLPPAIAVWRPPTWNELAWLLVAAGLATLGHLTLTQAFRFAPITVVQPFAFLQLVWATLLGLYMFGEQPDIWTWIGGAVIVGSATYIGRGESVAQRRDGARNTVSSR